MGTVVWGLLITTGLAHDQHLLDHVPDNNLVAVARTIECIVPVAVNVRPGNPHHQVNPAVNSRCRSRS